MGNDIPLPEIAAELGEGNARPEENAKSLKFYSVADKNADSTLIAVEQ